jgi:hypothetical protein
VRMMLANEELGTVLIEHPHVPTSRLRP